MRSSKDGRTDVSEATEFVRTAVEAEFVAATLDCGRTGASAGADSRDKGGGVSAVAGRAETGTKIIGSPRLPSRSETGTMITPLLC